MFTYLSLLIEEGFFDTIQVNFLIVGHTHTTIDQYFSSVSKSLSKCSFIGSPMSFRNMLNSVSDSPPMINRKLVVFYDYKSWLTPIINKALKWYSLPHVFLFSRHPLGRCFCQHKPFSTSPKFLPEQPENSCSSTSPDMDTYSVPLQLDAASFLGGHDLIQTAMLGKASTLPQQGNESRITEETVQAARNLRLAFELNETVDSILVGSAYEQDRLFEKQSDNGFHVVVDEDNSVVHDFRADDRKTFTLGTSSRTSDLDTLINDQNHLKSLGDPKKGYVFWIDATKIPSTWKGSLPVPLNPNNDVSDYLFVL
jgi:hypothetical protein